jgi:CheY-like chemotaxis protein
LLSSTRRQEQKRTNHKGHEDKRELGPRVLQATRESAGLSGTPVAVLTSSDTAEDRARAATGGANGYSLKPSRLEGYATVAETIRELCVTG